MTTTLTDGNLNSIDSEAERIMLESPETSRAYQRAKNTRTLVQEFRALQAKLTPTPIPTSWPFMELNEQEKQILHGVLHDFVQDSSLDEHEVWADGGWSKKVTRAAVETLAKRFDLEIVGEVATDLNWGYEGK